MEAMETMVIMEIVMEMEMDHRIEHIIRIPILHNPIIHNNTTTILVLEHCHQSWDLATTTGMVVIHTIHPCHLWMYLLVHLMYHNSHHLLVQPVLF